MGRAWYEAVALFPLREFLVTTSTLLSKPRPTNILLKSQGFFYGSL